MVDSGAVHKSTFHFIIPLCDIDKHGDIRDPTRVSDLMNEHAIDLSRFFSITNARADEINAKVDQIIEGHFATNAHTRHDSDDGFGKSWVWIPDNESELVRALIAAERFIVSTEGRYLLDISQFASFHDDFEEYYCKKIAESLATEFGVNASYFTVRGSTSCDELPYYATFSTRNIRSITAPSSLSDQKEPGQPHRDDVPFPLGRPWHAEGCTAFQCRTCTQCANPGTQQ